MNIKGEVKLWIMLHCIDFPIGHVERDTVMAPWIAILHHEAQTDFLVRLRMAQNL